MRLETAEERRAAKLLVDRARREHIAEEAERDRRIFSGAFDDDPPGPLPGDRRGSTVGGATEMPPRRSNDRGPAQEVSAPMLDQRTALPSRKLQRTGTPGVYRRGGSFCVIVRGPDGRQRKRAAKTMAEAKLLKATLTADVARGEFRDVSNVLFRDFARSWIQTYTGRTSRGLLESTRADYETRLEADAIPFFGVMRLAAIEPRHVRELIAHVAARGVSRGTIRLALAPVKAMFAQAVEDGLLTRNPAAGVKVTAQREEYDTDGQPLAQRVKALTDEELGRLLEEIPEPWRPFYRFLTETGLRIGEAVELRWRDVDLGRRRVRVTRQFYRGRVGPPKTKFGRRDVPLTEATARELWQRRAHAADTDLVFTADLGGRIDQSNLMSRVLKPAARRAGIVGEVGHHSLRHLAGSRWFAAGWNAVQVQRALGHHSAAFTLSTYVHALDDELPEPVAAPEAGGNTRATSPAETGRDAEAVGSAATAV